MTTYRKEGRALFVALSRGVWSRSSVREQGVGGESLGRFFSMSLDAKGPPETADFAPLERLAKQLEAVAGESRIERLQLLSGWSRHRLEEEREWEERHVRLHLEWSAPPPSRVRVTTIRGGAELGDIDVEEVGLVARALLRVRSRSIDGSRGLALAPPVAAAIAAAAARATDEIGRTKLVQEPHPSWPRDGAGEIVARTRVGGAPPPNVWRPSYRTAPVAAALHVEIDPAGESEAPPATALEPIGAVRISAGRARATLLVTDGAAASVEPVEIDLEGLAAAREKGARRWFPFGAGAWGRVLVAGDVVPLRSE